MQLTKLSNGLPGRSECSYPGGEVAHHQYTFCCAPVVPGKSYCTDHMKVVYAKQKIRVEPVFPTR